MGINFRGLAFKQSVLILIGITIVFAVLFSVLTSQMHSRLTLMVTQKGDEISQANVNYIDKLFNASRVVGDDIAKVISKRKMTRGELDEILLQALANARTLVPQIVAVVVAFEPGMGPETAEGEDYMRLARFTDNETKLITGSNYQVQEWYSSIKENGTSRWQEPFIGEFVHEPIAVYNVPLFLKNEKGENVLMGVLAVDMSIDFLKETVSSIPVGNSGYAMILSAKNSVVAYPKNLSKEKGLSELRVQELKDKRSIPFDRRFKDDKGLFLGQVGNGEESAFYYTKMESNNWTFMVVWPAKKFLEDQDAMLKLFALLALVGYAIMLVIVLLISARVAKPLKSLVKAADKLGHGDFEAAIPEISGHDEVAQFAWAFTNMRSSLKDYIEKEKDLNRIERELDFARNIQLGILPKEESEENSQDDRHELAPFLLPAKEVGGDFYDFFKVDNDHLCIMVGDVSGKGVPAALLMMVCRIILRTMVKNLKSVGDTFNSTNYGLAKRNKQDMFVTVWMGIVDLRTGRVEFASAGHNPPVVRHKDGSVEFIKVKPSCPMAAMEDTVYKTHTYDLNAGDMLFLYTDGVTEATNTEDKLFGDQRLLETLEKGGELTSAETCSLVKSEIDRFVGTAPQFDDITMLSVKFNGVDEPVWERYEKTVDVAPENQGELKTFVENILTPMDGAKKMQMQDAWDRYEKIVDVIPENQDILTAFVEGILAPMEGSMKSQMQVNIAIDEIYSNIVKFSGATKVTLIVEVRKATLVTRLTFIDDGAPYDPLQQKDPDITLSAEEREVGGLGIFIVKKTMDSVCYRRNGDNNELVITKTL